VPRDVGATRDLRAPRRAAGTMVTTVPETPEFAQEIAGPKVRAVTRRGASGICQEFSNKRVNALCPDGTVTPLHHDFIGTQRDPVWTAARAQAQIAAASQARCRGAEGAFSAQTRCPRSHSNSLDT
jgi:hypothetical protein